jgi:hypothetical protein
MNRFNELLEKRKNLTATIFEEEELIEISKTLDKEQLKNIDENLLTYSNMDRLKELNILMDKLIESPKLTI